MENYRISIDVGGTFTDFVVARPGAADRSYKTSSTPAHPDLGVLNGLQTIANDLGHTLPDFLAATQAIVHGTTVTTNALLTSNGAVTGLIATEGFRDVLLLRQAHRDNQWDNKAGSPKPLVPRERVRTVRGRIDRGGHETVALSEDDVRAAARAFSADGVQAVAVAFLFSFLNSAHEQRAAHVLREELPGVFISLSSDVSPQIRIYERTSTAVVNAYVGPVLQDYVDDLRTKLSEQGYRGPLQLMQSNGGLSSAEQVTHKAVTTLLSGPAGGPIASAHLATHIDLPKTMTVDMGGTSFEASLARGGTTEVRSGGRLAGYAMATPMLDISTIGAGGGSISWVDAGGKLRVGPNSAGARPGPACYGRGGTQATVTDANLLLGYIGSASFGAGELTLDLAAAREAVEQLATQLRIGVHEAAAGIITTINAAMSDSLRLITVRRGMDAREFAIIAAGGAGPLHAAALAEDLEIPLVVIPRDASVFCAAGILATDFKHDHVRTLFLRNLDAEGVEAAFDSLERAACDQLYKDGVLDTGISFRRVAEVRYVGQVHTIDMPLPVTQPFTTETPEVLKARFDPAHLQRFGHALASSPIEIVNIRVEARGTAGFTEPTISPAPVSVHTPRPSSEREAWFDGAFIKSSVYDAATLSPGMTVHGPALIELTTSTVVLPPSRTVQIDQSGAMLLHRSDTPLHAVLDQLRSGGSSV